MTNPCLPAPTSRCYIFINRNPEDMLAMGYVATPKGRGNSQKTYLWRGIFSIVIYSLTIIFSANKKTTGKLVDIINISHWTK